MTSSSSQVVEKKPDVVETLYHTLSECTADKEVHTYSSVSNDTYTGFTKADKAGDSSSSSVDKKSKMVLIGGVVAVIVGVTAVIVACIIAANAIDSNKSECVCGAASLDAAGSASAANLPNTMAVSRDTSTCLTMSTITTAVPPLIHVSTSHQVITETFTSTLLLVSPSPTTSDAPLIGSVTPSPSPNASLTSTLVSSLYNITLVAIHDVLLESGTTNFNFYNFLIIGKHPGYPKKRSLLQFEDLPSNCTKIISAKMYIWFWKAHKASWQSDEAVPNLNHTLKVHQVKKEWIESQATSSYRKSGVSWSQPYLGLDGTDADANYINSVHFPNPPPYDDRWIEFDITEAAQNWANGQPNYGVIVWSNRENDSGRDLRFYSREESSNKPYMRVTCNE